jgi:glutamyl-tRNA synthetase
VVRVRFAPSPTGNLHIGSLRTALFNWIFAKNQKGKYILRIEDTDMTRSEKIYEKNIFDGLDWTGLSADESPLNEGEFGPYRQSERMAKNIYLEYAEKLLISKHAYLCFCTDAELDKEREYARTNDETYVYSRRCLYLSEKEIQAKLDDRVPYTIKFKIPRKELTYIDLIRDEISFDLRLFSDFVLIKSDSSPSYNYAVVIDDMLMAITHVIRGEDHISNTPKQICIYEALDVSVPKFAHLPMILGPDKSKLSKRHGATSVVEYQEQGFLPEALFNYLVLLGWSTQDDREIMSRDEIVSLFSLDRITKSGAVFDINKLRWMNGQYIRNLDKDIFYEKVKPYIDEEKMQKLGSYSEEQLKAIIFSVRKNLDVLCDINIYLDVYLDDFENYKLNVLNFSFSEEDKTILNVFRDKLRVIDGVLTQEGASQLVENILSDLNLGRGKVYKAIRFACSARKSGPDMFAFIEILGLNTLLQRLSFVLEEM